MSPTPPHILNQEIELVPLERLKLHPRNPRRGSLAKLRESLEVSGQWGVLVANRRTGHVLAGNHRLMALREMGAQSVHVAWVDVDDRAEERILVADNRISDLGDNDAEALATILQGLFDHPSEGGLEGTGYEDGDLERLLAELSPPSDEDFEAAFDALPTDRAPIQNMTFTLHDDQAETVKRALAAARGLGDFGDTGNENSNGNALARVCELFLTQQGGGHGRR